ncbi:hypothetical protein DICPUDRAFT_40046 [Dictyostelium purpureum]|uniref:tRNA/rRNA methyltransferase SpoU type domain-containing protein n=1 Tax=Dictyostelium purpureum TaxID=5786 RepID=F0ZXH3_DICPU|nr:uncharacterized protein DICPUDRAFT_40046 [Dictyostelium purpureum]EGC31364.1 hypothetical protein DICPUDRAFT_40046 [Dictyostelium purpureum]|eukprot:XP_003292112.1 hypothetical protein DICPUDRAFT_40046 [Dictyostelium purpureum]
MIKRLFRCNNRLIKNTTFNIYNCNHNYNNSYLISKRGFCNNSTAINKNDIIVKEISLNKDNEDVANINSENEDIVCSSEKCGITFRVPSKLRGRKGYCPSCAHEMIFTRYTSNYKNILRKRREKYLNTLAEESKTTYSFDPIKNKPFGLSVVLEDCRSLHNVGSIFRTSDGSGFSHIYLCGLTGTPLNTQVTKSSLGSEEMVEWSFSNDSLGVVKKLKEHNVLIIGIEQTSNSVPLLSSLEYIEKMALNNNMENNMDNNKYRPICVVMGNEIAGISEHVINECDIICELPMLGNKNSLNVSITFGIVSYILSHHFKSLAFSKK